MIKRIHMALRRWPWVLLPASTAMNWVRDHFDASAKNHIKLRPLTFTQVVSDHMRGQAFVCVEFGSNSGVTLFIWRCSYT
jgi:hypothetical protein